MDKALAAAYNKNSMMRSGIYCITNLKNGKRYVGQSVHVSERVKQHLHKLKKGTHGNKVMQAEYKTDWKYFKWELLEVCAVDKLGEREAYWSHHFDCFNPKHGYNKQEIRVKQLYTDPAAHKGSDK